MTLRSTSFDSWDELLASGAVTRMQKKVIEAIRLRGPMTGAEIDLALHCGMGNASYHQRLSELKEKGLVEEHSTRNCSVTGKTAIAWRLSRPGSVITVTRKEPPPKSPPLSREGWRRLAGELAHWRRLSQLHGDQTSDEMQQLIAWIDRQFLADS